jgi:hypothetical protein
MAAQPFIQMKEFEVLLSMRAGRPFTTSFYTFPTKNRKDDLFVHHEVGALVTPFFHFLYQAMVVETILLQRGIELCRFGNYGCILQKHFTGIRPFSVGMFYATKPIRGKLVSPLTRFSNGRKRNLRPIYSVAQGDRIGPADVDGYPPQTFSREEGSDGRPDSTWPYRPADSRAGC